VQLSTLGSELRWLKLFFNLFFRLGKRAGQIASIYTQEAQWQEGQW
jgi:hypothetical protein